MPISIELGPRAIAGLPPVSILMYHQVGEFPRPRTHKAQFCHIKRFRAQMAYLATLRYRVIGMDELLASLFGGAPLAPRTVVLSFDDGYVNFRDYALPVLAKHRFPAALYMVSGLVGGTADWLTDRERPPLLDAPGLREVHAAGITIGSHTVTHPRLATLEASAIAAEVTASKARLEDVLGAAVDHFCYPYGNYDTRARDAVAAAGYRSALTCIRGAANSADNAFELPRKAISFGDSLFGYYWKLHMKHTRKDRQAGTDSY